MRSLLGNRTLSCYRFWEAKGYACFLLIWVPLLCGHKNFLVFSMALSLITRAHASKPCYTCLVYADSWPGTRWKSRAGASKNTFLQSLYKSAPPMTQTVIFCFYTAILACVCLACYCQLGLSLFTRYITIATRMDSSSHPSSLQHRKEHYSSESICLRVATLMLMQTLLGSTSVKMVHLIFQVLGLVESG